MKAWIIDDEQHSCEITKLLIEKNCSDIVVLGYETDPKLGLQKLREQPADIVFLDIEMPGMNGFDLLTELSDSNLSVIFITAYDQFAVDAFGVGAIDYLMKPIVEEDLVRAVERVKSRIKNNSQPSLDDLRELLMPESQSKLRVGTMEGYEFIPFDEIIHCESDNNYAKIHRIKDGPLLVSKTLKEIEGQLPSEVFIRVHNSHLVNKTFIKKYIKGAGGSLVMEGGTHVPVSKAKKQEVLSRI